MKAKKKKSRAHRQYGALPLRQDDEGAVEVRMITSRETRRWIVPKGWPIKGLNGPETAAREAAEEAGVRGKTGRKPVGAFIYDKRLNNGKSLRCEVSLYPLWVQETLEDWPESHQRTASWLSMEEAAARAGDPGLGKVLRKMAGNKMTGNKMVSKAGS